MTMNNDNLAIHAKKEKTNEIIGHYSSFGWVKVSEKENDKYDDLVDLYFQRKHKIKNKDELQLLQVYMENKLNELGKLEKEKHSKLTALALCVGVFGLGLIVFGILCCIGLINYIGVIAGLLSFTIAFLVISLGIITLPKVYKLEVEHFCKEKSRLNKEIKNISKKALELSGGEYEQDN